MQLQANNTVVNQTEDTYLEEINNVLVMGLKQLEQIDVLLGQLIGLVNKGSLKVADIEHTRKTIQFYRSQINKLIHNNYMPLDPKKVHSILQTAKELIQYLSESVATNLRDFKPKTLNASTRTTTSDPSMQNLVLLYFANEKALEKLKIAIDNIGLTTINKAYRAVEKFNKEYKVIPRATVAALIGLTGLALYSFYKSAQAEAGYGDLPSSSGQALDKLLIRAPNGRLLLLGALPIAIPAIDIWQTPIGTAIKSTAALGLQKTFAGVRKIHTLLRGGMPEVEKDSTGNIIIRDFDPTQLIGLEEQMEILENPIRYFKNAESYNRQGTTAPKGFLFYGPPGTGKTALAQWMAWRCTEVGDECVFINTKWSDLLQENGMNNLIEKVKKQGRKAVIFLDEIDTLGAQRDRWSIVLNELLNAIGGLNSDLKTKTDAIIIANTNKPEHLDFALRRSGRLKPVLFDIPWFEKRKQIFEKFCSRLGLDTNFINTDLLARQTTGLAQSTLIEICQEAQFDAKSRNEMLSQKHFQDAINKTARRINRNDEPLTMDERKAIAAYQAGSALAHMLKADLPSRALLDAVTIRPIDRKIREARVSEKDGMSSKAIAGRLRKYGKTFSYYTNERVRLATPQELVSECKFYLAGRVAQEVLLGSYDLEYRTSDYRKALRTAKQIELKGLTQADYSKDGYEQRCKQAESKIERYEKELKDLFSQSINKLRLKAIMDALINKGTLRVDEIVDILKAIPDNLPKV